MISQCIQQMAMKILKENPNIANNPNAQSIINVIQLRPAAVPAFTVPNPYANYGFGCYCGSSNNGCC